MFQKARKETYISLREERFLLRAMASRGRGHACQLERHRACSLVSSCLDQNRMSFSRVSHTSVTLPARPQSPCFHSPQSRTTLWEQQCTTPQTMSHSGPGGRPGKRPAGRRICLLCFPIFHLTFSPSCLSSLTELP